MKTWALFTAGGLYLGRVLADSEREALDQIRGAAVARRPVPTGVTLAPPPPALRFIPSRHE